MDNLLSNHNLRIKLFLVFILLLILGCDKGKNVDLKIVDRTNPFAQTFWGKNIKYLISNRFDGKYDTMGMDLMGNINFIREYGIVERREYNDAHFLTRYLQESDTYYNSLIFYQERSDSIVQFWVSLNHSKWNLDANDYASTLDTTKIVFKLNRSGQIILKRFDDGSSESLTYKDGFLIESKSNEGRTIYFYQDQDLLRMEIYRENEISEIHYFNDKTGLLDSTVQKLKEYPDRKLQYSFVYY